MQPRKQVRIERRYLQILKKTKFGSCAPTIKLPPPKKKQVGGKFLRSKSTAKSRRSSSERIKPLYKIGPKLKAC